MSILIMFPTARVAAVDVNVEEPDWELMVKGGIPGSLELVVRGVVEVSWAEQLEMVFELVTETSPVVVALGWVVSETDTGVLVEEEHDRAPMVCPMVVVFPDSWIGTPEGTLMFLTLDNVSKLTLPTGWPGDNPIFEV